MQNLAVCWELPGSRTTSSCHTLFLCCWNDVDTNGDNVTSGDNQQETARPPLDPIWIVGFVDGEGCFSVSLHRNERFAGRSFGWQINPSFHVYQHRDHGTVLEDIRAYLGVGRIRPKGPNSDVHTLTVQRRSELLEAIIPFFRRYPLRVKAADFSLFDEIVEQLVRGEHFTQGGFERIVRAAYTMNAHGKQRARRIEEVLNGSSETERQALGP